MTPRPTHFLTALAISIAVVGLVDAFTNELDTKRYSWDSKFYLDMAETGLVGNTNLVSPFAYRFLTPLLVRFLSRSTELPVETCFRLIAYAGAVGQLFCTFLLATTFGLTFRAGVVVILVTGFSLFNVKFPLFDVYRPEHLAYPLTILAFIAAIRGRTLWVAGLTGLGLQIREFLFIPGLIHLGRLAASWFRGRSLRVLLRGMLLGMILLAAVLVPRLVIPVVASDQFVDPLIKPRSLSRLISAPLNLKRDFNIVFATLAYSLPLLVTCTKARLEAASEKLRSVRAALVGYAVCVLLLAMYGGTDLSRFVAYLFVPQILLIGCMVDAGVSITEIAYMLIVVFIFNRIALEVPVWNLLAYLDFCIAYGDRVTVNTMYRIGELGVYVAGATALRKVVNRRAPSAL